MMPATPLNHHSSGGLSSSSAARVIRILEDYLAAREQGRPPHLDELTARHPEFAELLRTYVAKLEALHQAAGLPAPAAEDVGPAYLLPEGRRLGDFCIRRPVGRGGMGIVYEAEQVSLGRRVALKVLPFAAALDAKQLQRFKNEAQAAACLHHTHIVPVHAVGTDRGVYYYAMQFIDGQSLAELIVQLRQLGDSASASAASAPTANWPPAEPANIDASSPYGSEGVERPRETFTTPATLRSPRDPAFFRTVALLGIQAAEALEHAHQRGVVHRDVKPANLLLEPHLHLWVTDFGLAVGAGEGGLTLTGDLVGTLRYMSPEQALARRGLIDHRTDIYSLGVTLYELLALEPAYGGRDRQELLRQIAFEEPRPLRRLNPAVPRELETVVLKAMAKEAADRYPTAQELADDLRRILEHRPIRARRPTAAERLAKWARRHKPVVVTAAVLLSLALATSVVSSVFIWRAHQQTKAALGEVSRHVEAVKAKEKEANDHRLRAEDNFRKACRGVTELLVALEDRRWAGIARIGELRGVLSEQGLQFLQSFLNETNPDPAARLETGRAYRIVGSVYNLQRKWTEMKGSFDKAIDLFEKLAADFPDNPLYRHELGLSHNLLAMIQDSTGQRAAAAAEYRAAIRDYRTALARGAEGPSYNNLAWLLITCPLQDLRNPSEAVTLARQAVALLPCCSYCWNTLGVAYYRTRDWTAAVAALERSMQLHPDGGCGNDFFFLAMSHWQLNKKDEARQWYQRGVKAMEKWEFDSEPLTPYCEEAAALLGLPAPRKESARASSDGDKGKRGRGEKD
jgi:serine/threonine protein kinase/Flp pilus assembly protein TadD